MSGLRGDQGQWYSTEDAGLGEEFYSVIVSERCGTFRKFVLFVKRF